MKTQVTIPFDKALCIQQSWIWWRHAWRNHFKHQLPYMGLGALGTAVFLSAMLRSDIGLAPILGPVAAIFAYLLLRAPTSYLISFLRHRYSLAKLEDEGHEIQIAFDEHEIAFVTPEKVSQAKWEDIICFGTIGSLMVIYIDDSREPCFFAREETGDPFFDALLAKLEGHPELHPCWR